MKNLTLLLIGLPVFLMTSLNFYGGEEDINHPIESRAFTCTSCHASIIDGIVINGKVDKETLMAEFQISIPNEFVDESLFLNIKGEVEDEVNLLSDAYGNVYAIDPVTNTKKKENSISVSYSLTEEDFTKNELVFEGVLSNLDKTSNGESSFYKKIKLSDFIEKIPILVYPTITNTTLKIENLSEVSQITLYNIQGQKILEKSSSDFNEEIDCSNIPNGNYFVVVDSENEIYKTKILVQH